MPKNRYIVRASNYFIHGSRTYEVIDTQNSKCCYDSIMKTNCVAYADRLNRAERAVSGGFNGRKK